MKAHRFCFIAALLAGGFLAYIAGCKYDVTEPLWYQPYTFGASPLITSVNPATEAAAGTSTIAIRGHNLFAPSGDPRVPSTTVVLFGPQQAELASVDSDLIIVRRPNMVSDSCAIRVIPHAAGVEAVYGPYKLDRIVQPYGGFIQNLQLGGIAVDLSETVYVIATGSQRIYRTTSSASGSCWRRTTR